MINVHWRQSQQDLLMNVDGSREREREKGVHDDSMVFALSNQANDDEYVLRWEGLQLRRNGESFFWPSKF